MSTEFIKNFVSELVSKYGDASIHELQNYLDNIKINNETVLIEETTLYPFFTKISNLFKEQNPIDYTKLETFCQNIRIVNTCKDYSTYYFPNIDTPIIVGKNYNSWAKHGELFKHTEFYCKYESNNDDKIIYRFSFIKDNDVIEDYDEGDFDSLIPIIEKSYGKFIYEESFSDYSENTDYEYKKILFIVMIFYPIIKDIDEWNMFTNILCNEIANISDWVILN